MRGNNAGIEAADPASDVVLLNNDVEFPQHDWLPRMRALAHSEPSSGQDIGVVGCRLVLPDGRLLHAGTYILPDTAWGQQIGALEKDIGQYTADREVEGIVFACAYIRSARWSTPSAAWRSTSSPTSRTPTTACAPGRPASAPWLCGGVTLVHDEHGSTQRDPEALMRLFQKSREIFRQKWETKLEARYRHELLWQSIMNFPSGYAMSCRELLRALEDEGVRTVYRYVYGPKHGVPRARAGDRPATTG